MGLSRHSFLRYVFGPPARPPWAASRACGGCRIASRRLHNPLNQVSVLQIVCRPFYVAFYVRCFSRERAHAVRATLHTIPGSRGFALPVSFSRNKGKERHIQWLACRIAAAFILTFGCGIRVSCNVKRHLSLQARLAPSTQSSTLPCRNVTFRNDNANPGATILCSE